MTYARSCGVTSSLGQDRVQSHRRLQKSARISTRETTMTKLIQSALAVAVLLIVTLSSTANSAERTGHWTDLSDPYGGYGANTEEGNRAFWEYQARHGG